MNYGTNCIAFTLLTLQLRVWISTLLQYLYRMFKPSAPRNKGFMTSANHPQNPKYSAQSMKHDNRCFKNPHKKNQIRNEATRDRVSNIFCTSVRFFWGRIWEGEIEAFKCKAAATAVFQNRCKWTRFWNSRTSTSVARVSDNWAGIQLLSKKSNLSKER